MNTVIEQSYTQWAIEYPWHVSGEKSGKYPTDENGNCTCNCKYCTKKFEHKATVEAHMH